MDSRVVVEHALAAVGHAARHLSEAGAAQPVEGLEWLEDHHAIATPVLRGLSGVRVALRPAELTLLLLDPDGAALKTRPLEGCTVDEAFEWLHAELGEVGTDAFAFEDTDTADLPPLPASLGGVLGCPDRQALEELERWLGNADHVLRTIARTSQRASAVRCAPDRLALRTELRHRTREGEEARLVVVGASMGDAEHPQPFFFVAARPAETIPESPDLSWERHDGASRAILPADEIVGHRGAEEQASRVDAFLRRAVPAAHDILHREWRRR